MARSPSSWPTFAVLVAGLLLLQLLLGATPNLQAPGRMTQPQNPAVAHASAVVTNPPASSNGSAPSARTAAIPPQGPDGQAGPQDGCVPARGTAPRPGLDPW